MHRIDHATAVSNLFTEGNPSLGQPATVVTDDWLNDVQEELITILAAAGVTPVKGTQNQLLAALSTLFVAPPATAPQFDSDTSIATTEFVQRALGNYQGVISVTDNVTLAAGDVGKIIVGAASMAGKTITLPAASSVPNGSSYHILCGSVGSSAVMTVAAAGGDTINPGVDGGAGGVSSVAMNFQDTVELVRFNGTSWRIKSGSLQLKYTGLLASSMAAAGYQKLPSGLIVQWGKTTSVASNSGQSVTFPLAFPNACWSVVATPDSSVTATSACAASPSTSGFTARNNSGSANIIMWFAIGN